MAEGFAADVTGEGPGPAVGAADVHLKPVWGGEHLGAGAEREATGGREGARPGSQGHSTPTQYPAPGTDGRIGEGALNCLFWGMCCVS